MRLRRRRSLVYQEVSGGGRLRPGGAAPGAGRATPLGRRCPSLSLPLPLPRTHLSFRDSYSRRGQRVAPRHTRAVGRCLGCTEAAVTKIIVDCLDPRREEECAGCVARQVLATSGGEQLGDSTGVAGARKTGREPRRHRQSLLDSFNT
ncbi:hypothetical protein E2C01_023457 [Portunus trituberculatus]|uniref:Uncharacterized protein n=1 Tax=Portunus trituberculatus TaxID=210409 RepID=A0A5B7EA27_PORTR|nr:hypothetical protein [Portunus trituberculatus]